MALPEGMIKSPAMEISLNGELRQFSSPLTEASLIGSGMGIVNPWNLRLIIDSLKVPVLVDDGVGTASDAAIAMELGCDSILMNAAIAHARTPVLMASAMKKAVEAGREAFLAGRMPCKYYSAAPSSPTTGLIDS